MVDDFLQVVDAPDFQVASFISETQHVPRVVGRMNITVAETHVSADWKPVKKADGRIINVIFRFIKKYRIPKYGCRTTGHIHVAINVKHVISAKKNNVSVTIFHKISTKVV